ncbi:hypothetical protein ACJBV4_10450, partial [Streptococcus suis]
LGFYVCLEYVSVLRQVILSHDGLLDFGSPVRRQFFVAVIVEFVGRATVNNAWFWHRVTV